MRASDVFDFWFKTLKPEDWYKKNPELDQKIREQFLSTVHAATRGELFLWRQTIQGRLSEILVLDQFPRNIFRDHPDSFSRDSLALTLAQEAVASGKATELPPPQRAFLYLPYMHSESLVIHDEGAKLFAEKGLEINLDFEKKHRKILEQFGRYPHRNAILGRISTAAELEFLKQPNSGF